MHDILPWNSLKVGRVFVELYTFWNGADENLGFKFFYPSRDAVSTYAIPDGTEVRSTQISAGMTSSLYIFTKSPAFKFFHSHS